MKKQILIKGLSKNLDSNETKAIYILHGFLQSAMEIQLDGLGLEWKPEVKLEIDTKDVHSFRVTAGKPDQQRTTNQVTPHLIENFALKALSLLLSCLVGGPTFQKLDMLMDKYNEEVSLLSIDPKFGKRQGKLGDAPVISLLKDWGDVIQKLNGKKITLQFPDADYEIYPSWMGKGFSYKQLLISDDDAFEDSHSFILAQSTDKKRMWRFDTSAEGEFSCHLQEPELERIINEVITIGYKDRLKIKGIKITYKTRDGFAFKPKFLIEGITVLERYLNQQGDLYSSTLASEKPPATLETSQNPYSI